MRMTLGKQLTLAAATLFLSTTMAQAISLSTTLTTGTITYSWTGTCTDCTNLIDGSHVVTGWLTLTNDVNLSSDNDASHFVQFHYDGSNLVAAFDVYQAELLSSSSFHLDSFPASSGTGNFFIAWGLADPAFITSSTGDWRYENTIPTDYGTNSVFNAVPEPASLILLGSGLGGLALAAYRRKKA